MKTSAIGVFFEDPDNYSVEDGKKVKETLEEMKEYEKTRPAEDE